MRGVGVRLTLTLLSLSFRSYRLCCSISRSLSARPSRSNSAGAYSACWLIAARSPLISASEIARDSPADAAARATYEQVSRLVSLIIRWGGEI